MNYMLIICIFCLVVSSIVPSGITIGDISVYVAGGAVSFTSPGSGVNEINIIL